jgi:hypothetical protein
MLDDSCLKAYDLLVDRTKKDPVAVARGLARAANLSSKKRADIARKAAKARWGDRPKLLRETHAAPLVIGPVELQCGVLENGTRVFSRRGVGRAFGSRQTGINEGALEIPPFLGSKAIFPFISEDLMARLKSPVEYLPKHGGRSAIGYEASILPAICEAILDARKQAPENRRVAAFAEIAETLLRGFARVGVIALIDEATGYQYDRARNALAEILEKFIRKELAAWARMFPDDYYREMYRLRDWKYDELSSKRPPLIGNLTTNIVYQRIAPGVLQELERINPRVDGNRRAKHHQWLTDDVGHPKLKEHLVKVITLMQASRTWDEFKEMLNRALPKHDLPLFEWADKQDGAAETALEES